MEKLIFLIAIVVISMLHSWWQKRKGEGDADANVRLGRTRRESATHVGAAASDSANPTAATSCRQLGR